MNTINNNNNKPLKIDEQIDFKSFNKDLLNINVDDEWKKFCGHAGIKTSSPKVVKMNLFGKVAAAIVLLIGIGAAMYGFGSKETSQKFCAENQTFETTVENSTKICLNKNTEIECTRQNNKKFKVKLRGEAYFQVEKNPERTFEITTENITVTVRGTAFDVCEKENITTVTVTEGVVDVKSHGNQTIKLTKGEQYTYNKENGKEITTQVTDLNCLAWKSKSFEFNNTDMESVMHTLQQVYDFKYCFEQNEIKELQISGKFENQNLKSIFKVLEPTLNIRIEEVSDGNYQISKQ